jgi:hypothetical protein
MTTQNQTTTDITTVNLEGLNTSQKIRHLHSLGFTRGQIAKFLEKRYQHVRNVLVTPIKGA